MQILQKLPPSKAWRLAHNIETGKIYTGGNWTVYCGAPHLQQGLIDAAKKKFDLTGELTPDGSTTANTTWDTTLQRYVAVDYQGPSLHTVELFDFIPVIRIEAKFKSLYCGKSDVAVKFTDKFGHDMLLRGSSSDRFFKFVGEGKIKMDTSGFYEFDVTFVKGGEKVYMELYGY